MNKISIRLRIKKEFFYLTFCIMLLKFRGFINVSQLNSSTLCVHTNKKIKNHHA